MTTSRPFRTSPRRAERLVGSRPAGRARGCAPRRAAPAGATLALRERENVRVAILPSGALLLETASDSDDASDGLSPSARSRVARAFERGPGHALLDLGASELDALLAPPLAF